MPDDIIDKFLKEKGITQPKKPDVGGDPSVARVLDDEFGKLGYPAVARQSILGDVGRENAWNRDTIFKGHLDPANKAYNRGIISWQKDRQDKLNDFLKQQGVYGKNDDDELRGMARFMDQELRTSYPDVHKQLLNPKDTYSASEALRQYIKYNPGDGYNSYDPEFRVKNNADWAKKARELGLAQDNTAPVASFDDIKSQILGKQQPAASVADIKKDVLGGGTPGPTNPANVIQPSQTALPAETPYTKRDTSQPGDYWNFETTGKAGDLNYLGMTGGKHVAENGDGDKFVFDEATKQFKPATPLLNKLTFSGGKQLVKKKDDLYTDDTGDEYKVTATPDEKTGGYNYELNPTSPYTSSVSLKDGSVLTRDTPIKGGGFRYRDENGEPYIYDAKGIRMANPPQWWNGKTKPDSVPLPENRQAAYDDFRKAHDLKDSGELRKDWLRRDQLVAAGKQDEPYSDEELTALDRIKSGAQQQTQTKMVLKSATNVARKAAAPEQIIDAGALPEPLPNQDYQKTGTLKTANGRELKLDTDPTNGVLPEDAQARFVDEAGNTYLLKTDGSLADESLAEVAERVRVNKVPINERNTVSVDEAKQRLAFQAAAQIGAKYKLDKNEVYQWILKKGLVDVGTNNPTSEDNLYQTTADVTRANANAGSASMSADGQLQAGATGLDSTYSLTGRQLQELLVDVSTATAMKEKFALDQIAKGAISPEPTQGELDSLGVSRESLFQNPAYYAAMKRGEIAQTNIQRIATDLQKTGQYDGYTSQVAARGQLGIISPQGVQEEINAYNDAKAMRQAQYDTNEGPNRLGVVGQTGRSVAMAGGLETSFSVEDLQKRRQYWIDKGMASDLAKYGSFARANEARKEAADEDAAAAERVSTDMRKIAAGIITGQWEKGSGDAAVNALQSIVFGTAKGAIKSWGGLFQGFPVWSKYAANYIDSVFGTQAGSIKDNAMYQFGTWIKDMADYYLPTNKDYDKSFAFGSLPQGAGSSFGFMPAAVGGPLGIALFSTMQMTGDSFEEATGAGATPDQAQLYAILNGGLLGWTEVLGLGETWQRMLKGGAGAATWKKLALDAIKESAEEVFLNEGPQDVGQNLLAKITYDPDRKWDKDVAAGMAAAGISAPLVSVLVSALLHVKHAHMIKRMAAADIRNGGPAVRDLGEEAGFYVYGKPVAETEDLKPLFEKHREIQKQIEGEFDALKNLQQRFKNVPAERQKNFFGYMRDTQKQILELIGQQRNVSEEIRVLSGIPTPDALDTKETAEKVKNDAVAESPAAPVPTNDQQISGEAPLPEQTATQPEAQATPEAAPQQAEQTTQPTINNAEDVDTAINDLINGKPTETTNPEVQAQPAPVGEKPLVSDQSGKGTDAEQATTKQETAAAPTPDRGPITLQGIKLTPKEQTAAVSDVHKQLIPLGFKKNSENSWVNKPKNSGNGWIEVIQDPQVGLRVVRGDGDSITFGKDIDGLKQFLSTGEEPVSGDNKKPWEKAEEAIKSYVENLPNLSDKELKAESKRVDQIVNSYGHGGAKAGISGQEYFEDSKRMAAVDAEIRRRAEQKSKQPEGTTTPTGPNVTVNLVGRDGLTDAERGGPLPAASFASFEEYRQARRSAKGDPNRSSELYNQALARATEDPNFLPYPQNSLKPGDKFIDTRDGSTVYIHTPDKKKKNGATYSSTPGGDQVGDASLLHINEFFRRANDEETVSSGSVALDDLAAESPNISIVKPGTKTDESKGAIPKTLTFNGVTINIDPIANDKWSPENRAIEEKTIREVMEDPQKWLDAYDNHKDTKGGTEINSDHAKELFEDYEYDPLSRVAPVHAASSMIADLAFRIKLKQLPANSEILFLAGGGGSGKGYALKHVIDKEYALILDGTMKTGANNIAHLEAVKEAGHKPELAAVFAPAEIAAIQNVRRSIGSRRLVPSHPLISAHNGFRNEFSKGGTTERYAATNAIPVRYLFNDGKSEPSEISVEKFTDLVYNEDGKVEQMLKDATNGEIDNGGFKGKQYDPRLRDAFNGKNVATKDTRRGGKVEGPDGSADEANKPGNIRGEQGTRAGPEVKPAPSMHDIVMEALNKAEAEEAAAADKGIAQDLLNDLGKEFGFEAPKILSVLETNTGSEPAFDPERYARVNTILSKAFTLFKGQDAPEAALNLIKSLRTQGVPMTAIREMSPYITRFMEEQFGGEQNASTGTSEDSANITNGEDLRPDNGVGGQTSDEAGNANAPGDMAGGQSETANETGSGEQTTSPSDETGTESGSSTGPKSGSDEQASSDVRDTSDGGNTFTPAPRNFHVTDELDFGKSFSQKTRARQNIAALRLLQKLDEEGRLATPEEQKILAGYVGWGGIPQIFDARRSEWAREYQELKDLLPQDEYEKARRSIQDAHFTSKPVVNAIWAGLQRMGFTNGAVLEPSMGTGNFFGLMPRGMESRSQLTGVELDPLTAKIAQHLYPQAAIYNKGFQEFYVPANSQDAAIGNPPFGAQTLRDATSKELSKLKIHGYFFAKSINAVRPGGLLGMVVSDGFLDARDSQAQAARQYVSDRARLVGAIRLPNTAFKGNAGTEVTTDIIFLQRIDPANGVKSNPEQWLNVSHMDDEATGDPIPVNQYFVDNPGQLLGKMALTGTMYGPNQPTLEAREGQDLEEDLAKAILALPQNIITDTQAARTELTIASERKTMADYPDMKPFNIGIDSEGKPFYLKTTLNDEALEEPLAFTGKALERVKGMIGIRELATRYISLQAQEDTTEADLKPIRDELNKVYDDYVKKYGYLNEEANKRVFREDVDFPLLQALEKNFDKGASPAIAKKEGIEPRKPSAKKADMLLKRTVWPHSTETNVENAHDAMIASMLNKGRIDPEYMATVYDGKTAEDIIKELGDQVFHDPQLGSYVMRDEYLSGDVKTKLAEAEAAAQGSSDYDRNILELQKVQPVDVPATDIFVKLGSAWIPMQVYRDFFEHLTQGTLQGDWSPALGRYSNLQASTTNRTLNEETWGTRRAPATTIIEAVLSNRNPVVRDRIPGSRPVAYEVNREETAAAVGKAEEMKAAFKEWIWADDDRRKELSDLYNEKFNRIRKRTFDGSYLVDKETGESKIPGLSKLLNLRPHIMNAVSRIIQSGKALIDHAVGAGKTPLSITAAMEMRRLGLSKKPMFVVPNHLIEQWSAEFKKFYPGANVLAASRKDFEKGRRREMFAKIATGDWDAVIVAHSSFSFIPVPREVESNFMREQLNEILEAIAQAEAEQLASGARSKPRSLKDLEKMRDKLSDRIKALLDTPRDSLLDFAEMGVDSLFVDEAHKYKNLFFTTQKQGVAGLGNPNGSQRAFDMYMKTQMILQRNNNRNVVFLTGTPVSNSLAEIFHMQRYLQKDLLEERGVKTFDAWANMFADDVQDWEINAAGQFKQKTRFSKIANLPELRQMWQSVTDSISHKDLKDQAIALGEKFPVPKEKHIRVLAERSPEQAEYIGVPQPMLSVTDHPLIDLQTGEQAMEYKPGTIIDRLEHWKNLTFTKADGSQGQENVLRITTHARQAGLDMRLIDQNAPEFHKGKLNLAAEHIIKEYEDSSNVRGTQLVFLDVTSPKGKSNKADVKPDDEAVDGELPDDAEAPEQEVDPDDVYRSASNFDAYATLRQKLIDGGIPANQIAFIHDFNTDLQKADLFGKVNRGDIRVLFGSTPKMGEGMNVQKRLVALHNIDAPWKPSDLEQRNGRIIRQGNELYNADPDNFEARIYDYATEKTYDARLWEIIEQKSIAIDRFRFAGDDVREVEDISPESANAAAMKAAASGDPRILESIQLLAELRTLETQYLSDRRAKYDLKDKIRAFDSGNTAVHHTLNVLRSAQKIADANPKTDTTKVRFADKEFRASEVTKKPLADEVKNIIIGRLLRASSLSSQAGNNAIYLAAYRGFGFTLTRNFKSLDLEMTEIGDNRVIAYSTFHNLADELLQVGADAPSISASGVMTRMDNLVDGIANQVKRNEQVLEQQKKDIESARKRVDTPFAKEADLNEKKARSAALLKELRAGNNIDFEADQSNQAVVDMTERFPDAYQVEFQRTDYYREYDKDPVYLFRVQYSNGQTSLRQGPIDSLELDESGSDFVRNHTSGILINNDFRQEVADLQREKADAETKPLYAKLGSDEHSPEYYGMENLVKGFTEDAPESDATDPMKSTLDDNLDEGSRMTVQQMKDLPFEPIEKVLDDARITRTGDLLKMNAASQELIRRSFEESRIQAAQKAGKTIKPSDFVDLFTGVFMDPNDVAETTRILREKADEAESLNYPDKQVQTFRDHADMLDEAAKAGKGTAVMFVLDKTLPHERFHQSEYLGAAEKTILNRHSDEFKKKLDNHPLRQILWDKHYSKYNEYTREKTQKVLNAILRSEIPAYLLEHSEEDLAAMGITPEMRADYFLTWFEGYADKNGLESLDNFEKEELDVQNFIQQIKEARQTEPSQNGGTRQANEEDTGGPNDQSTSKAGTNAEGSRGTAGTTRGINLTGETYNERRKEKRQAEKDIGLGPDQRLRSLPLTLRRAGLEAVDDAYDVFHDTAAIEAATALLEKHGVAGSIDLLRTLPAKALDAEHGILSFMIIKTLQTHAASIMDTNPELARANFELSLQVGREHAIAATQLGRFTRVPSIVGPSVETLKYAIQGIVEAREGAKNKTLPPEAWERIDALGRELEAALAKVAEVRREKRNLQAKIKRLENEKEGKKRRRSTRSTANRQRLVDLIQEDKKRVKAVDEARQRLKEQFAPVEDKTEAAKSVSLKSVLDADAEPLDEKTLNDFANVGAMMLTEGLAGEEDYLPADFKAEMLAEYGDVIQPHFDEIYKAAWNKRAAWLDEERYKATKERIQDKYNANVAPENQHDLEDWEVEEILGQQKEAAKRRRFIERYHQITAGARNEPRNLDAYRAIIADLTKDMDDSVALGALVQAERLGTADIHKRLVAFGITDEKAQREALRKGNEIWKQAQQVFKTNQDKIANDILEAQGDLHKVDELQWIARNELKKAQASVADEMRRIKNGESWYRLSQLADVFNASRTLMASFDLSASLRQGGFFTFARPLLQRQAFANMYKSIGEKGFGHSIMELEAAPNFVLSERAGLDYAVAGRTNEGSIMGEELFKGEKTIEHVPIIGKLVSEGVVKWSERTYTAFLDTQRYVMFDVFAKDLMSRTDKQTGLPITFRTHPEEFKKIADFINIATGRGVIPSNKFAKVLMDLPLFAPRYTLSRLQLLNMTLNPVAYANMPPEARKIIAKNAVRFYGTTMGILGLVTAFGAAFGASVNWDPDDDDFLKIKIHSTKIDILSGLGPQFKLIVRMVQSAIRTKAGFDNRLPGEFYNDVSSAGLRFIRGKMSPVASVIWDWSAQKDYNGNEFNLQSAVVSRVTPLVFSDMYDAYKIDGITGLALVAPTSFLGLGVSTYKDRPERAETPAEKMAVKAAMYEMASQNKPGMTQQERDKQTLVQDLRARSRQGQDIKAELEAAVRAGNVTEGQKRDILAAAHKTYLVDQAEGASLDERNPTFLRIWDLANAKEKADLQPLFDRKMKELDVSGKLSESYRKKLSDLGGRIPGDVPMPSEVRSEFSKFGIHTPDVGESLTIRKGEKTKLDSGQYSDYRSSALRRIYDSVSELLKDPDYQNLSDDEKQLKLEKVIRRQRSRAMKSEKSDLRGEQ